VQQCNKLLPPFNVRVWLRRANLLSELALPATLNEEIVGSDDIKINELLLHSRCGVLTDFPIHHER
jgi:hypothetical protein